MKTLQLLLVCLLLTTKTFAHFYWLETNPNGKINEPQDIKVFFGEYSTNEIEKTTGSVYQNNAKKFMLFIIDSHGNKTALKTIPKDNHYLATFTPKENGVYTVVLDNPNYEVLDFTKYDYGIFKPNYQSITQLKVGDAAVGKAPNLNPKSITIAPVAINASTAKLQVLFKNKPLPNSEVTLFYNNQSEKIKTNQEGIITFSKIPNQKYILEATHEDKQKGAYNGKIFQFTWHCAVFTIN